MLPSARPSPLAHPGLAWSFLFLLFSYVFLANSWIGDDAYITFRVVWNFLAGYGLTFNPAERVQAFTHPLWMFLLSGAYAISGEFFFTVTFVSWAVCVATGAVLVRWAGTVPRAALLVLWLLTSKAFVDYTASGLENPLSYLLAALFYTRYLDRPMHRPTSPAELRQFALLASLGFLNRPDAALIYAVPLAEMIWRGLRVRGASVLKPLAVGLSPALAWIVFATLYYGFPLPNTYYAKVANGIPRDLMIRQGIAYVLNSIRHDPLTLGTIGLSILWAARGDAATRRVAASAALYVAYAVGVGGDFMSGRFFALPFLLTAMTVAPALAQHAGLWAAGALAAYTLLVPLAPVKTGPGYDGAWPWRSQNGVRDERGHYHQSTNIFFFSPFRELPDHVFARSGRSFREADEVVTVQGSIGMFGLNAGPTKYVVDRNALSDPLLARLPVSPRLYFEFYAGHYFRDLPDGYLESLERDENLLTDPLLRDYYERLRRVTRDPVFDIGRLRDIWALNAGRYRSLHAQFEKTRAVALSIRADNERFSTDVGDRDPVAGVLRATGRAGLLQYGPGIPMKAGGYRARWVGLVQAAAGADVGFVDVKLADGASLKRVPVLGRGSGGSHVFAEIDFTIDEPARALEYRLYVNEGVAVTLERVELYSSFAIPATH
jgi:arabinofuranosyltransferase